MKLNFLYCLLFALLPFTSVYTQDCVEDSLVITCKNGAVVTRTISICRDTTIIAEEVSIVYKGDSLKIDSESNIESIEIKKKTENAHNINYLLVSIGNIKRLDVAGLGLKHLDIEKSNNLRYVNCSHNFLDKIIISDHRSLNTLLCNNNNFRELTIPKNTSLATLDCSFNFLTNLTIINSDSLVSLNCSNNNLPINKIPILDTSKENFKEWKYDNQVYYGFSKQYSVGNIIDMSDFTIIVHGKDKHKTNFSWFTAKNKLLEEGVHYSLTDGKTVFLQSTKDSVFCELTNPLLPDGANIKIIPCKLIPPLAFSFSYGKEMKNYFRLQTDDSVHIITNGLKNDLDTVMKMSGSDAIYFPEFAGNVQTVKVYAQGIKSVDLENTDIQSLTFYNCTDLEKLNCNNDSLKQLDLRGLTNLRDVECVNNRLESLDLQGLQNLSSVNCSTNPSIGTLNFSESKNITGVRCSNAGIQSLVFSNETNLSVLECNNNQNLAVIEPTGSVVNVSQLVCNDAALRIGTLPHKTGNDDWFCSNQKQIPLQNTYRVGETIDLSIDTILYVNGEPSKTVYRWYKKTPNVLLDNSFFEEISPGRFLVKRSLPIAVFCIMTNVAIPGAEFRTTDTYLNIAPALSLTMGNDTSITINGKTKYPYDYVMVESAMGISRFYSDSVGMFTFSDSIPTSSKVFVFGDNIQIIDVVKNGNDSIQTIFVSSKTLEVLNCPNLAISSIAFDANCKSLKRINCAKNNLENIDLSFLENLTYVNIAKNKLNTIAVSLNKQLEELYVNGNRLNGSLDVSANVLLNKLNCSSNVLTNVLLPESGSVTDLYCSGNQLDSLDLSAHINLDSLNCSNNLLSLLNISKNLALKYVICRNNNTIKNLNLDKHTALQYLDCSNINLESLILPVPTDTLRMDLVCASNNLERIETSDFLFLNSLNCSNNRLQISTMPDIKDSASFKSWIYINQKRHVLQKGTIKIGESIDLHSEYKVKAIDSTYLTSYVWITEAGGILQPSQGYYTEKEGVFTFLRSHIDPIYCIMNNEAFSANGLNIFEAGSISIVPDAAFVIKTRDVNDLKITLAGVYNFNHVLVDWDNGPQKNAMIGISGTVFKYPFKYKDDTIFQRNTFLTKDTVVNGNYISASAKQNLIGDTLIITDTISVEDTTMKTIVVYGNSIKSLSFSNTDTTQINSYSTSVEVISCPNSFVDTLDVNRSVNLRTLNCANNIIDSLAVDMLDSLEILTVANNKNIGELDVSKNISLKTLNCDTTGLQELDVSNNRGLKELSCQYNKLSELNIENNIQLEILLCAYNKLQSLNVGSDTLLRELKVQNNAITALNLKNNKLLKVINCNNNKLTKLNVDSLTLLTSLYCSNNSIKSLSLKNIVNLQNFSCANNEMVYVDYKNDMNLYFLNCSNNRLKISSIPISTADTAGSKKNYWKQEFIPLPGIEGKEFFVGETLNLMSEVFKCDSLTSFNWYMGGDIDNYTLIEGVDYEVFERGKFVFKKNLESFVWCEMINPALPNTIFKTVPFNVVFPPVVEFSTTSTDLISFVVEIPESETNKSFKIDWGSGQIGYSISADKYPFITGEAEGFSKNGTVKIYGSNINKITLDDCEITDLKINRASIESISCKNNKLKNLDLSKCENLKYLDCSYNKINELYLNEHLNLAELRCNNNKLDSLILDSLKALNYLDCSHNKIVILRLATRESDYVDCSYNNLTFSTFPDFVDIYSNQELMKIPNLENNSVTFRNGTSSDLVDLSSEYSITNGLSDSISTYVWLCSYYNDDNVLITDTLKRYEDLLNPNESIDYTFHEGGRFSFDSSDKIRDSVYCVITNGVYPDTKIQTQKINVCDAFVNFSIEDGCSPYAISNFNLNTNADSLIWYFGNDEFSTSGLNTPKDYVFINKKDVDSTVFVRLDAISKNGCRAVSTTSFTLKHQPTVKIAFNRVLPFTGVPYTFKDASVYSKRDFASRTWYISDRLVSNDTAWSTSFSETGEYSISLISEISNGCIDTATQTVSVEFQPNFKIQVDGEPGISSKTICSDKDVSLQLVGGKLEQFDTYAWYRNSLLINNDTVKISVDAKGEYFVKISKGTYEYKSDTITIHVQDKPSNIPEKDTELQDICSSELYVLDLESKGITNWEKCSWFKNSLLFEDDSLILSTNEEGVYYGVLSSGVCIDTTWNIDLTVKEAPQKPSLSINKLDFCAGENIIISAPTLNNVKYEWYKDGETFSQGVDTLRTVAGNQNKPVRYSLKVTSLENNCFSENEKIVNEYFMPGKPSLEHSQGVEKDGTVKVLCGNDSVAIWPFNNNNDAVEYLWEFNGKSIVKDTIQVKETGIYICKAQSGYCVNPSVPEEFRVVEVPQVKVENDKLENKYCGNEVDTITLTKLDGNAVYAWQVGNTTINDSVHNFIQVNKQRQGLYKAKVLYNGCTIPVELSHEVTFYDVPDKANFEVSDSISLCKGGDSIVLAPMNIPTNSFKRIWFRNGDTLFENVDSLKLSMSGTYVYKVESSESGCASISNPINVAFKESPSIPELYIEQNVFCSDKEVFGTYSIDSVSLYQLEIDGIKESDLLFGSTEFRVQKTGRYVVKGVHASGCESYSKVYDIIVNESPVITPDFYKDSIKLCSGNSVVLSLNGGKYDFYWFKDNVPIRNANADSLIVDGLLNSAHYHAMVKDTSNGCTVFSDTTVVAFFKIPESNGLEISGNKGCFGEFDVTISNGVSNEGCIYQWYYDGEILVDQTDSSISGRFLKEGKYTLSIENENNRKCAIERSYSYIHKNKIVNYKPIIISFNTEKYNLQCSEQNMSEYVWYYNEEKLTGANDYSYFAGTNYGTYIVGIKDKQMECFEFSPALTIPFDKTKIDFSNNEDVIIYPNPTYGWVTVKIEGDVIKTLRIINQIGEILQSESFVVDRNRATVSLVGLDNGVYFIEVGTKHNNYVKAVVKK